MSNKYGIPEKDERDIRARDKTCVYCHKEMKEYPSAIGTPGDKATIEHLNHLPPWNDSTSVAICCGSCNSSRSDKKLLSWFKSSYCLERNINEKTVAEPVKDYILKNEKINIC